MSCSTDEGTGNFGFSDGRIFGLTDFRMDGLTDFRIDGLGDFRTTRIFGFSDLRIIRTRITRIGRIFWGGYEKRFVA